MIQEQVQTYSGIITFLGDIQNGVVDGREFYFQLVEMRSLDNQYYLKTYQIRLFGKNIRRDLKYGDLAVFKNGLIFNVSENYIFLKSFTRSHILIGENEILNDQGRDYLNKLKDMEQQSKNQQQQQEFYYNNQDQLQNFQGIICDKWDIKEKQINGQKKKFRIIKFMNFDEKGHFQLYKIKLIGVRAHQRVRISQKILIKNSSIKKIKEKYIILKNVKGEDVTQIFVGQEIIKKNCKKDEYKRFMSKMDGKVDEMNKMLENMKIKRSSKKIKKNF